MPNVFAAKGKAVGFEAHGLVGHIAREDDQVGPAEAVAVLLFDGPQQAACFVEVDVVRPRVEWRKALVARATTTTAIGNTVRACGMPRHAHHQTSVVTPVGRPPVLAVGHDGGEVFLQRGHIELFHFIAVVEGLPHRVGLAIVLVEDVKVERLGPPSHVGIACGGIAAVHHWALAFV